MHDGVRVQRSMVGIAMMLTCGVLAATAQAQVCGDADGSGSVTVTDGVNVLRAAAGLSGDCPLARCDVDGSGAITVTDGVNVLSAAAGLSVNLSCTPEEHFVDNGDGTVTDQQTGLQWEKKTGTVTDVIRDCSLSSCPDPHAVANRYQWCLDTNPDFGCDTADSPPDGGAFTDFLATLNTPPCFAGHCDWRLPSEDVQNPPFTGASELETILDLSAPGCGGGSPCIDPIFGPTVADSYWSTTTFATFPGLAWLVDFADGNVPANSKELFNYVRAVRAGS